MSGLDGVLPEGFQFIDYRKIEWHRVKRANYFFYQLFRYDYPGPVRNLRQRLIVVPTEFCAGQRLCDHQLKVTPQPVSQRDVLDGFGNRIFELEVDEIERHVDFEFLMSVERTAEHNSLTLVPTHEASEFLSRTKLTADDEQIAAVTRELQDKSRSSYELAEKTSDWVHHTMHYGAGATDVKTPASQVLMVRQGLCQDYAHLMIAICRRAGLPSRYVSGHMLGEGSSHAWVEVLLPSDKDGYLEAVAFDPTNQRRPNLKYITVARGRDYSDVSPSSGSFNGPYSGRLTFAKKSGLTMIEYSDGEITASHGFDSHSRLREC